jgi:phospholipid/cholesterol/gamma-HCH transport system substrate-binding protein
MNGIVIGTVRDIHCDQKRGGAMVLIDMKTKYALRADSQPRIVRSLLGDSSIAFDPGTSEQMLSKGAILEGTLPVDPMMLIADLNAKMSTTLESFASTSQEWQKVARNLNGLLDTNHGNIQVVIARTAKALNEFTVMMKTANSALANADKILGDPQYHESMRRTIEMLPKVANETHKTILAIRQTVDAVNKNMQNLQGITEPLAEHSKTIVTRLDNSMRNLETLTSELVSFVQIVNKEDGSLKKLISDPELYRNLNQSARSMAVLLENVEDVIKDVRIFADKIARHPEILGVKGAINGSSGLKDESVVPANYRE